MLLKNAVVHDGLGNTFQKDVLVENGRIVRIADSIEGEGFDLSALTGRKRLLSSTKGMPYPTRIITSAELPSVLADYRKPLLDAFSVQAKTATIGSLSIAKPMNGQAL